MPKIIQTDMQFKALQTIKSDLKSINDLNLFLQESEEEGSVLLQAGNVKAKFNMDKALLDNFADSIRKDYEAEIKKLSKANSIELSEEDLEILERKPARVSMQHETI